MKNHKSKKVNQLWVYWTEHVSTTNPICHKTKGIKIWKWSENVANYFTIKLWPDRGSSVVHSTQAGTDRFHCYTIHGENNEGRSDARHKHCLPIGRHRRIADLDNCHGYIVQCTALRRDRQKTESFKQSLKYAINIQQRFTRKRNRYHSNIAGEWSRYMKSSPHRSHTRSYWITHAVSLANYFCILFRPTSQFSQYATRRQ